MRTRILPSIAGLAFVLLVTLPLAAASHRHLVIFAGTGAPPADFAAEVAASGGSLVRTVPAIGLALVAGLDDAGADALRGYPGVQSVDTERSFGVDDLVALPAQLATATAAPAAAEPGEAAFFPLQWHLRAIGADRAWEAGVFGSPGVSVAVLDTGLDYDHPDLAGRVDLDRSISLLPDQDLLVEQFFPGRHPITDLHFHGTFAGALIASNAVRTAGVSRDVTLFGVKVCDLTGDCREGEILAAIVYAADAGADVINMSIAGFGADSNPAHETPGLLAVTHRAFNYANQQGTTVVVAAGNQAEDLDHNRDGFHFWCDSPHVVCVSATGPTSGGLLGPWPDPDSFALYSNFGRSAITVAAPGGSHLPFNVGGWTISACTGTSLLPGIPQICAAFGFLASRGTSFATPHVAGLAALLAERHPRQPAKIRALLRNSASDLGQPGRDPFYGAGRIDVAAALGLD